MPRPRAVLIWSALAAAVAVPLVVAGMSPLLQWRQPVYIAAGFAGIVALALLLVQTLLAGGYLPGLPVRPGRLVHRGVGVALLLAVVLHVGGLWLTSPPDVVDALTFTSPTPFSAWGVIAMWGVFAAAALALMRGRMRVRTWRLGHSAVVAVVVVTSVIHAVLIEGTMGTVSKLVLCGLALAALVRVLIDLRVWRLLVRRRA
ncbi:ferric reductase [Lutimaribacter marinistellae]|uniref:Ferric reductase n=1 Tax=Lutimaribacter marinistellae TaxID=1820329 RepID=A0ABV7TB44_9RHOB